MTRTARATYPRALNKDRSESKTGHDKSIRKGGAGPYSWGSLDSEVDHEMAALDDERINLDLEVQEIAAEHISDHPKPLESRQPAMRRLSDVMSNEELETARKFRKNALKRPAVDLSAIARTSSGASTSPNGGIVVASDAETGALPYN
ncbi:hypothetical protein FPV67DRAFT_1450852 [Lyophyllum atratum]|nr:hypothetical protein FPV67DRAFT_1450852 [Lyophyllum atratum]